MQDFKETRKFLNSLVKMDQLFVSHRLNCYLKMKSKTSCC